MSEAASNAPTSPGASDANSSTGNNSDPNFQAEKVTPAGLAQPEGLTQEEFEEISLGSIKGKVSKTMAKNIKELERAFHSQAQGRAALEREYREAIDKGKKDPDWFLQQLGLNPDEYAQKRLSKFVQMQSMSPEQREAYEAKREAETYKAQVEAYQAQQKKEQDEREDRQAEQEIQTQLVHALKKSSLPADEMDQNELGYIAARVVAMKAAADDQGLNWTWDQCVARVEKKWWDQFRGISTKLSPEQLQERLDPSSLKKWREYDVNRVTQKAPKPAPPKQKSPDDKSASEETSAKKKRFQSEQDFEKAWDAL